MIVTRFADEYDNLASFLECRAEEIHAEDASILRWVAYEGDAIVGTARGRRRPDGRMFVDFAATAQSLLSPIVEAVAADVGRIHAVARTEKRRRELEAAGFRVELVDDEFEIAFATALRRIGRLRLPSRFRLDPPHRLHETRLAALDTALRQDVPGTDGWQTSVEMWRHEVRSSEYDPTGYLVGVDEQTGDYCGLIRVWRNRPTPRLGLLAVTKPHRRSLLGPALLRAGLEGASRWGSATFVTSTSPANPDTFPALARLRAKPTGRRYQMRSVLP